MKCEITLIKVMPLAGGEASATAASPSATSADPEPDRCSKIRVQLKKRAFDDICPICHEEMLRSHPDSARLLCGHYFHYECIRSWYIELAQLRTERSDMRLCTCPLCFKPGGLLYLPDGTVDPSCEPPPAPTTCQAYAKSSKKKCTKPATSGPFCSVHSHAQ